MRALLCRCPLSFLSERGQFPFEQAGVPDSSVTGRGKTYRRRVRRQTCPCEIALSNGDRDGIDELDDRRIHPGMHDLFLVSKLPDANELGSWLPQ